LLPANCFIRAALPPAGAAPGDRYPDRPPLGRGEQAFPARLLLLDVVLDHLGQHRDLSFVELDVGFAVEQLGDQDLGAVMLDIGFLEKIFILVQSLQARPVLAGRISVARGRPSVRLFRQHCQETYARLVDQRKPGAIRVIAAVVPRGCHSHSPSSEDAREVEGEQDDYGQSDDVVDATHFQSPGGDLGR
jgi:hypothetical protein